MSSLKVTDILLAVVLSFVASAFFLWLLNPPVNVPLALIGFFLTLAICLKSRLEERTLVLPSLDWDRTLLVVLVLSSVVVIVVPPIRSVYLNPLQIPAVNYVRFISAALLTLFLPGYFVLRTLTNTIKIDPLAVVVLSYLLTVILVPLAGMILLWQGLDLGALGPMTTVLLNLLLFVPFALKRRPWLRGKKEPQISASLFDLTVLLPAALFVMAFSFMAYNSQLVADQWLHLGRSSLLYKGLFLEWESGAMMPHWWFHLHLAMIFGVSGLPLANTYSLLGVLNVMPLLAFYLMASSLLRNVRGGSALASLFTLFSGFGWAYYLDFRPASYLTDPIYRAGLKTYDIVLPLTYVPGLAPDVTTSLILVGLPAIFSAVYLISDLSDSRIYPVLLTAITTVGLISHPEFGLFLVILAITIALGYLRSKATVTALSATSGVVLAIGLRLLAPTTSYEKVLFVPGILMGIPFGLAPSLLRFPIEVVYILILGVSPLFHTLSLRLRGRQTIGNITNRLTFLFSKARRLVFLALLYVYFLCFVIWSSIIEDYTIWDSFVANSIVDVPWYFYPMRLGVIGLLAVVSVYSLKKDDIAEFPLVAVWVLTIFLLGQFALPLFRGIVTEHRLIKLLVFPLAIFAALPLTRLAEVGGKVLIDLRSVKNPLLAVVLNRRFVASALLTGVIVLGLSSTFLCVEHNYLLFNGMAPNSGGLLPFKYSIPDDRYEAYNHMFANIDPYSETALSMPMPGYGYWNEMRHFSGLWQVPTESFDYEKPANALRHFDEVGAKFVYLRAEDFDRLDTEGSYLAYLLSYLEVEVNNAEATVYEMPTLAPPSNNATLALAYPGFLSSGHTTRYSGRDIGYLVPYTSVALTGASYVELDYRSEGLLDHTTILLPYDPAQSYEADRFLDWINNGGNLVVWNAYPSDLTEAELLNMPGLGYVDDLLDAWTSNGNLTVENGTAVLEVNTNTLMTSSRISIDESTYPFLILRARVSDKSMPLHLAFLSPDGKVRHRVIADAVGDAEWHVYVIDVKGFGDITNIRLYAEADPAIPRPAELHLDYVAFAKEVPSEVQGGAFRGWFTEDDRVLPSDSPMVSVLDGYDIEVYHKTMGSGKVVYVDLYPYLRQVTMGNRNPEVLRTLADLLKWSVDYEGLPIEFEVKAPVEREVPQPVILSIASMITADPPKFLGKVGEFFTGLGALSTEIVGGEPEMPPWNEWDIPWVETLTSPYHFALLLGIAAVGVVIYAEITGYEIAIRAVRIKRT